MDRHANNYGAFCTSPLPGQPQIAVTHAFFVHPHLRGKGNGKRLKKAQMRLLAEHAFDFAICTVRADNVAQKAVLEATGWEFMRDFYSRSQDTQIEVWGCSINAPQNPPQTGDQNA
jgi:GNAT superfamily N-acetyltransferase